MTKPLFSIITVVFNDYKGIQNTLDSVINQSTNNYEFIIIDGKSSDGTIDIIKENLENINTFISEEDCGIYDAMNKGIAISKGEYILFMNSGDIFFNSTVLEEITASINGKESVDFILGRSELLFSHGHKINNVKPKTIIEMPTGHQSMFIHDSLFSEFGTYNTSYIISADMEFWVKANLSRPISIITTDTIIASLDMNGLSNQDFKLGISERSRIYSKSGSTKLLIFGSLNLTILILKLLLKLIILPLANKLRITK